MSNQELRVIVAKDASIAELLLSGGVMRESISVEVCRLALNDAGVAWNAAVEARVRQWLASEWPTPDDRHCIVAESQPAIDGVDGHVEWSVDSSASDDEPQGNVDHYGRSRYIVVRSGQVLGEVIPPTDGVDGVDVKGDVLAARRGASVSLRVDDTILLDATGRLVAQADGVLFRDDGGACIRSRLEINGSVDFGTGNLDFPGPILIQGGICDRFVVTATGEVEVHKLIEGATIRCGGNLLARSGIASRSYSRVEVTGDLEARYLDNVRGTVQGSARIMREIINCNLSIEKQLNSPQVAIIGGAIAIGNEVCVGTIGSPAGVRTRIMLGSIPRLEDKCRRSEKLLAQILSMQATLEQERRTLLVSPYISSQDKERLTEIAYELDRLELYITQMKDTYKRFEDVLRASRKVELKVLRRMHEGVRLAAGDQEYEVTTELAGPFTAFDVAGEGLVIEGPSHRRVPIRQITKSVRTAA